MGLFSKIWKGIKKTFKKIGKGIKKAFKSFGKFMNKIGIVGQIAMSFILPGIGNALLSTFGKAAGWLASGSLGAVGKAAGWVLGKAVEFGKFAVQGYKTVTGAVTDFIGTAGKFIGGKLGIGDLPNMTLGEAWGEYTGKLTDSFSKLGNAAKEFWDMDIDGALPKPKINLGASLTAEKSQFVPEEMLGEKTDFSLDEMLKGPEQAKDLITVTDTSIPKVTDKLQPFSILDKKPVTVEGFDMSKIDPELFKAEEPLGTRVSNAFKAAPSKVVEKGIDKLSSIPANLGQEWVGQKVGIYSKPMGDPGPAWGPRVGFESPSKYYDISQVLQPIQPLSFGDYVNTYAMGGENQGTYLGSGFWESYMQRSLAA